MSTLPSLLSLSLNPARTGSEEEEGTAVGPAAGPAAGTPGKHGSTGRTARAGTGPPAPAFSLSLSSLYVNLATSCWASSSVDGFRCSTENPELAIPWVLYSVPRGMHLLQ